MVFQRSGANEPNLLGMQVEDQGSRYGGIVLNGVNGIGVVCGSAWKKDPGSGVIGVEKGPLIPVV